MIKFRRILNAIFLGMGSRIPRYPWSNIGSNICGWATNLLWNIACYITVVQGILEAFPQNFWQFWEENPGHSWQYWGLYSRLSQEIPGNIGGYFGGSLRKLGAIFCPFPQKSVAILAFCLKNSKQSRADSWQYWRLPLKLASKNLSIPSNIGGSHGNSLSDLAHS